MSNVERRTSNVTTSRLGVFLGCLFLISSGCDNTENGGGTEPPATPSRLVNFDHLDYLLHLLLESFVAGQHAVDAV